VRKVKDMAKIAPTTDRPDYWDEAIAHLMKRDRILKKIIPRYPDIWLKTRGNPFITLARSICGQQISVKAAESVWQRLLLECGKRPTPASVQKAGLERLRAAVEAGEEDQGGGGGRSAVYKGVRHNVHGEPAVPPGESRVFARALFIARVHAIVAHKGAVGAPGGSHERAGLALADGMVRAQEGEQSKQHQQAAKEVALEHSLTTLWPSTK
jgi:hypothetical protein